MALKTMRCARSAASGTNGTQTAASGGRQARPQNTAAAVAIIQQSQRVIIDQEKPAFDDVCFSFLRLIN